MIQRVSSALLITTLLASCSSDPVRKTYHSEPESKPTAAHHNKSQTLTKAQALYSRGDYQEALSLLNTVSESALTGNERPEYHNLKGLVYLGVKDPVPAETSFRKALSTNKTPEFSGYYQYNLATAQFDEGKLEDAYKSLDGIDIGQVDSNQQAKILKLKERIAENKNAPGGAGTSGALPSATPWPSNGPSAAVSPTPSGEQIIPQPQETYNGSVNPNRIGLLLPLSGKYEAFGKKAQRAIELAFQNYADSRAKKFELIAEDSGESVESEAEALKKLVEEQRVIAVIGPLLSKGLPNLAARSSYYQVPMISIAQVQGPVASHLFSCSISNRNQISKIVEYAMKTRGFSKFAVLAPSNNAGEELAHTFWDEVESRKGEIRGFELYDPTITDFRNPVDKTVGLHYLEARAGELHALAEKRKEMNITHKTMKTAQYYSLPPVIDFDAVFIADEAKTVGQVVPTFAYRDAKNLSYLGITSWNSPQLIQRGEEQVEGATFPVAFNTLNPSSSTKAFYDLYVATYNTYPGELDAIAFDSAALVLKVMRQGPNSRNDFKSALEGLSKVDGATGSIGMSDHRCTRELTLYTVKNGKFEIVKD